MSPSKRDPMIPTLTLPLFVMVLCRSCDVITGAGDDRLLRARLSFEYRRNLGSGWRGHGTMPG